MTALTAFAAFLIERLFGYPAWAQALFHHPVEWIGAVIAVFDKGFNRKDAKPATRRFLGVVSLVLLLAIVWFVSDAVLTLLRHVPFGWGIEALLASSLFASRQLGQMVGAVADGLAKSLDDGRHALSHIVGRDTAELDEAAVARAAIETLAENTSDGVIAPLFFMVLFGLPGIALYKAINTADSMLGHLSDKYGDFGWAAAKLDDVANFIPARLTALLIALAAGLAGKIPHAAWNAARTDGPNQDSPNSGWPEAAMAGALGLRLGGPRAYRGEMADLPWMGTGRAEAIPGDIHAALSVYTRVCWLALAFTALIAAAVLNLH